MFRKIPFYIYILFGINILLFFSMTFYILNHRKDGIETGLNELKKCEKDLKALRLYKGKKKCNKISVSNQQPTWLIIGERFLF
jgi:hypothetical protein